MLARVVRREGCDLSDVLLFQTPDGGEIQFASGDLVLSEGLETAVYLSLFGGNEDDSGIGADDALEWWGNKLETDTPSKFRSETAHLLRTLPLTPANLQRLEEAAAADLAWMTSEVADSIAVEATLPARNTVLLTIVIAVDGQSTRFTFNCIRR